MDNDIFDEVIRALREDEAFKSAIVDAVIRVLREDEVFKSAIVDEQGGKHYD